MYLRTPYTKRKERKEQEKALSLYNSDAAFFPKREISKRAALRAAGNFHQPPLTPSSQKTRPLLHPLKNGGTPFPRAVTPFRMKWWLALFTRIHRQSHSVAEAKSPSASPTPIKCLAAAEREVASVNGDSNTNQPCYGSFSRTSCMP